jgi:hypothetical protein
VNYIKSLSFEDGLSDYSRFDYKPDGKMESETVTYSDFVIKMEFSRIRGPHLIYTYFPSFMIVLSSWLGFLIGISSIPGRLTVTVILLLVLINMR